MSTTTPAPATTPTRVGDLKPGDRYTEYGHTFTVSRVAGVLAGYGLSVIHQTREDGRTFETPADADDVKHVLTAEPAGEPEPPEHPAPCGETFESEADAVSHMFHCPVCASLMDEDDAVTDESLARARAVDAEAEAARVEAEAGPELPHYASVAGVLARAEAARAERVAEEKTDVAYGGWGDPAAGARYVAVLEGLTFLAGAASADHLTHPAHRRHAVYCVTPATDDGRVWNYLADSIWDSLSDGLRGTLVETLDTDGLLVRFSWGAEDDE